MPAQYTTAGRPVFVTGGAGFGINMIRYLLARSHSIVSFDIAPFDYPERDRITAITGDIRNIAAVRDAIRGCDIVITLRRRAPFYTPAAIMSTDVDGTRHVLQAALDAGISRIIHISSTAVYGTKASGAGEDSSIEIIGPYAEAKVLAENECASFRNRGLCVPVSGRRRSWDLSGSGCGRSCTTGPRPAAAFPSSAAATTDISCSTSKTCATPFTRR